MGGLQMKFIKDLLFCPFLLFAQTEFVTNSNLAVEADFNYSISTDYSSKGPGFGLSFYDKVDLGFEYNKLTDINHDDISISETVIYLAYNFKEANNCLKVLGGYSSYSFENNLLSGLDIDGPFFGVIISPKIINNESFCLMPSFGFSMTFLSDAKTTTGDLIYSTDQTNVNVKLELNLISHINDKFYLFIAPSVSKDLSNSKIPFAFGFNFGALLNFPKN